MEVFKVTEKTLCQTLAEEAEESQEVMCVFNEQGHTIENIEVRLVGDSPKGISLILITLCVAFIHFPSCWEV